MLGKLYDNFLMKLSNDNSNSFVFYVLSKFDIKEFVLGFFDNFYVESDINKFWFFKNCQYLYLFKNNKNQFQKLELKKIFDKFFNNNDNDGGFDSPLSPL